MLWNDSVTLQSLEFLDAWQARNSRPFMCVSASAAKQVCCPSAVPFLCYFLMITLMPDYLLILVCLMSSSNNYSLLSVVTPRGTE